MAVRPVKSATTPQISSFAAAETARRTHEGCIRELQDLPASSLRVIAGIELAAGVETPVAHRLGRVPLWVGVSAVRNASTSGHVEEVRSGGNRSQTVILKASGWGATITVDVVAL